MKVVGNPGEVVPFKAASKANFSIPSDSYNVLNDSGILTQYGIDDLDSFIKVSILWRLHCDMSSICLLFTSLESQCVSNKIKWHRKNFPRQQYFKYQYHLYNTAATQFEYISPMADKLRFLADNFDYTWWGRLLHDSLRARSGAVCRQSLHRSPHHGGDEHNEGWIQLYNQIWQRHRLDLILLCLLCRKVDQDYACTCVHQHHLTLGIRILGAFVYIHDVYTWMYIMLYTTCIHYIYTVKWLHVSFFFFGECYRAGQFVGWV